jgi:hypothetical protein
MMVNDVLFSYFFDGAEDTGDDETENQDTAKGIRED